MFEDEQHAFMAGQIAPEHQAFLSLLRRDRQLGADVVHASAQRDRLKALRLVLPALG